MSASPGPLHRIRRRAVARFSPLYGDWMSASETALRGWLSCRPSFSPLYEDWMSASLWTLAEDLPEVGFQSPLWGLDECFVPLRRVVPTEGEMVSVPFMGIG